VSATPGTVAQLIKLGYEVVVESGAGAGSKFADHAYVAAGASIGDALKADVMFGVGPPSAEQLDALRDGAALVSILSPDLHPGLAGDLSRRRLTALAMDAVPRISRA
jgi:H+-translocating NAD(P) transhydrogenase subunit alpha